MDLRAILGGGMVERLEHGHEDGPNCGHWLEDKAHTCGKKPDEGRHIRYGPQVDYPGYHFFEPEQIHNKEKCAACQLDSHLAKLVVPALEAVIAAGQRVRYHGACKSPGCPYVEGAVEAWDAALAALSELGSRKEDRNG